MVESTLISIIDDDESLRAALVGLVRSLGYRASGFANAEDFLAADQANASGAIVTDIQMPGLSGIELKQRLVADGCAAPVIMITARAEPGLQERAFASGALCVLKKPFAAEALIDCLERALAK
ncbi:MAG TPA: response regulator [Verrucomicrobiae bacterium]|nr:response regulator [Verrucomicrobiae bacterium]